MESSTVSQHVPLLVGEAYVATIRTPATVSSPELKSFLKTSSGGFFIVVDVVTVVVMSVLAVVPGFVFVRLL